MRGLLQKESRKSLSPLALREFAISREKTRYLKKVESSFPHNVYPQTRSALL